MSSIADAGPRHRRLAGRNQQVADRDDRTATVLLSLPEAHPYRALAEGRYRPSRATDDERWELAREAVLAILAADVPHADEDPRYAASQRNALCALAYWAARDGEAALVPDALLDEETIQRYVADDSMARRASHRSRVALASAVRLQQSDPNATLVTLFAQLEDPFAPIWDLEVASKRLDTLMGSGRTADLAVELFPVLQLKINLQVAQKFKPPTPPVTYEVNQNVDLNQDYGLSPGITPDEPP
jgi:hypothetical protein